MSLVPTAALRRLPRRVRACAAPAALVAFALLAAVGIGLTASVVGAPSGPARADRAAASLADGLGGRGDAGVAPRG